VTEANAILNAVFRSVAYSDPASCNIKLHTGDPGAAGTSNPAGNTTRKAVTFSAAADGAITTTGNLSWTGAQVTTTETYTHASFWSDLTAGTFIASRQLEVARAVTAGQPFTIFAGEIDISLTPVAA
jgi:hypothetical protein